MSEVEKLTKFTKARLDRFQSDDGEKRGGERRAALARLRLGVGKEAGTVPETWKYIYEGFPDELAGKGDAPSYAENAIHAALTLYAMHAQGKGNPRVHDGDAGSIGMALNNLKRKNPENEQGILRRFNALVTAKTADEINLHARGVIQLLKQGEIKLDYVRFAKDLYNLQFSSESAKHVQRRWGRDFYHVDNKSKSESESKNKGGSDA